MLFLLLIIAVAVLITKKTSSNLDANDWEERNSGNIYNESMPVRKGRNLPSLPKPRSERKDDGREGAAALRIRIVVS